MGKAKGIRVNALAKELGIQSKSILDKLKDEGLGEKAPNHMSVLPLGLAESVREWFSSGELGGTAVETAAPVAVAEKTRTSTRFKRKVEESSADHGTSNDSAVQTIDAEAPMTVVTPAPTIMAPPISAPVAGSMTGSTSSTVKPSVAPGVKPAGPVHVELPTQPQPATLAPTAAPVTPTTLPHTASPAAPAKIAASASPATPVSALGPAAPASSTSPPAPASSTLAPPITPAAPASPGAPPRSVGTPPIDPMARPIARPTITLANRQGLPGIERKPITPAPKLVTPAPAIMQGPRVVREEKPDVVAAPRARRPMDSGGPPSGITQARPAAGRGVRPSEDDDDEKKKAAAKASGRTNSNRRRGPDGRRGEAMEKLREFTDADLIERRDRLNAAAHFRTGFDAHLRKSEARGTHAFAKTTVERGGVVEIEEPITVRTLAAALGVKSNDIISKLMKQGVFATINQALDQKVSQMLAADYGLELEVVAEQSLEEELVSEFDERQSSAEDLKPRPPVVTILGHVDHGKTSLLDKIRSANVAAGEAGGITQHTAAWMVTVGEGEKQKRVTFIDTPGHQAFTAMRARGANMTDVVVLVVSAAEGMQPQTIESINHARAAGVPIVVALNKIDRADANPDMVLGQLAGQDLNPVEWGGTTEVIRTSATTGQGVNELIEILDYQAELLELKSDLSAPARGTVIEARIDPGLGSVATVLVQDGTLRVGDAFIAGNGFGKIRMLLNDQGVSIPEAGPSTPVIVSGMNDLPSAGEKFFVTADLDRARMIGEERAILARQNRMASQNRVSASTLLDTIKAGDVKTINLIIKADVQGSLETLVATVTGQNTEEVKVRVIHSGVGAISESDVELAIATKGKPTDNRVAIIGFHVVPDETARALAEQNHVDMKLYRVIYEIFDDLKKSLSGMLEPETREKLHGHVEIRKVYKFSKVGSIAGCFVRDGHIQRGSKIRLIRDGRVITEDLTIETLKRVKDDVKEVKAGLECGIKLAGYDDIKEGDVLEGYVRETFERTL